MARKNPPAKWVLPETINPTGRRCFVIQVPDDPLHVAAFRGTLLDLAAAYKWQDDPEHKAREVALVWRDVLDAVTDCEGVPTPIKPHGREVDFDMSGLRVDCDCNVWITCCDGTEKQILTSDQVKDLITQPAGGSPQPPAGGGCQGYFGTITGLGRLLVPAPVSTGDTITIDNAVGASNDAIGARWNCPDGAYYFLGGCGGPTYLDGDAPLPTVPAGKVVVNVDGTWYDLDGEFTVPGGVENANAFFAFNYPQAHQISGSVNVAFSVCNNADVTYTHTFDFTTGTHGWYQFPGAGYGPRGVWTPGSGWTSTDGENSGGTWFRGVFIRIDLPTPVSVNRIEAIFPLTLGGFDNTPYVIFMGHDITLATQDWLIQSSDLVGSSPYDMASDINITGVSNLLIAITCSDNNTSEGGLSGSCSLTKLILTGPGSDPF